MGKRISDISDQISRGGRRMRLGIRRRVEVARRRKKSTADSIGEENPRPTLKKRGWGTRNLRERPQASKA